MSTNLVVRRVPEHGWAVFDRETGEKVLPEAVLAFYARRKFARAALAAMEAGGLESGA